MSSIGLQIRKLLKRLSIPREGAHVTIELSKHKIHIFARFRDTSRLSGWLCHCIATDLIGMNVSVCRYLFALLTKGKFCSRI